jgi:hypothetical protein
MRVMVQSNQLLGAALMAAIMLHGAPARAWTTCEQFAARLVEGATYYKTPVPQFDLWHVNDADAGIRYFKIRMFDNVRSIVSCWHGQVGTFAADANDAEPMSAVHLSLLMGIGFYGDGMAWQEAIGARDDLLRAAKAADPQTAEMPVDFGRASLIISVAGAPSFVIDHRH